MGPTVEIPLSVELIVRRDPPRDMDGFADALQTQYHEGERLME
jgi:hypothetical protein